MCAENIYFLGIRKAPQRSRGCLGFSADRRSAEGFGVLLQVHLVTNSIKTMGGRKDVQIMEENNSGTRSFLFIKLLFPRGNISCVLWEGNLTV